MLKKKLIRDFILHKTQFISIFLMVFLGTFVYGGLNAQWFSLQTESEELYNETNLGDMWLYGENFTNKDILKIEKIKNVKNVERRFVNEGKINGISNSTVEINCLESNNISKNYKIKGKEFNLKSKGIWVDSLYAEENNIKINDKVTLNINGSEYNLKVLGHIMNPEYVYNVKDETELIPNHKKYGYVFVSSKTINPPIYNQILIDTTAKNYNSVKKAIKDTDINYSMDLGRDDQNSYNAFKKEIDGNKDMVKIFPVVFFLIALLCTLTTMTRLIDQERSQIGALISLGFKKNRIIRHYISYNFFVSLIAAILGNLVGTQILPRMLFRLQKATYSLPNWNISQHYKNYLVIIIVTIVISILSYFLVSRELKNKPANLLKTKEIKIIKEGKGKRKIFKKMSFNLRWNISDIFRNKTKSAIAIIGIAGATMLLFCGLSLYDSISGISKWMSEDINKYEYKTSFNENALDKDIENLVRGYTGDLVSENIVEIKKENISKKVGLTVLESDNLIKYEDEKGENIRIENGIGISLKLSEELNIKKGSIIKWKFIMSDEWQKDKIVKIYRTPINQGLTTSKNYLEKENIEIKNNTFLSNKKLDKNDLVIKSVQSKKELVSSFDEILKSLEMIVYIMMLASILLSLVVLNNLGTLYYIEKYRDIATLKVLGFRSNKLRKLLFTQNAILSVIGIAIGIPMGRGLLLSMIDNIGSNMDIKTNINIAILSITIISVFIFSMIITFFISRKVKTINMVEALKKGE